MPRRLKCFLSYAHADQQFVREEIVPILSTLGMEVWVDYEQIEWGAFIPDAILKGIRQAHVIVAVLNRRSTYMNFEVGAALGQNKPTLAIVRDYQEIPLDLRHISFLKYSEADKQSFFRSLSHAIEVVTNNLIDKAVIEAAEDDKIIGISVGTERFDVERELRFTADFLNLVKEISGAQELSLIQTSKGSFTSFFSIDLKAWAELVEKVLFFVPEWQKKKAENLRINAEIKKLEAETNKINSDCRIAEVRLKIEQAEAMMNLLAEYKELGIKVQIGDEVLLSLSPTGLLDIKEPERLE